MVVDDAVQARDAEEFAILEANEDVVAVSGDVHAERVALEARVGLVGEFIPFGFQTELQRSAGHQEGLSGGHKEVRGDGVMHFDGVASGKVRRQSVFKRIVIVTHDLDGGASILMVTSLIEVPSGLRVELVVVVFKQQDRNAE